MKKIYNTKLSFILTIASAAAVLAACCLLTPACRRKRPVSPPDKKTAITADSASPEKFASWLQKDFSPEKQLIASIRQALASHTQINKLPPRLNINLERSCAWVAVTLFQQGAEPIRWISKRKTGVETINRIIAQLLENKRLTDFQIDDPNKCRILLEVITEEHPHDVNRLQTTRFDENRFEPGITGLKLIYDNKTHLYMPTDAAVYGDMTIPQVFNRLSKKIGVAKQTNKISRRIATLRKLPIQWSIVKSVAFVSYGNDILPLYRGYPVPVKFSDETISEMVRSSARWLVENMTHDGKFLYYYDGVRDSVIDHAHPNRTIEDNYYNILRHSGGVIALLRAYELEKKDEYLLAAKKALDYQVRQTREHSYKGRQAYYLFDNQKAKLGGSGIGLVALLRYRQTTGDTKYDPYIFGLANHLLSRIDDDGEMIGYYIHPNFNNGKPIISPTPEEKKQLFSFYYPGEALLGLALFEHQMPLSDEMRKEVRDGSKKALDFLVFARPVKYADMFEPLPSDGWLMQAIEEWSVDPEFQKKEYLDFVFNDANKLISNMYNAKNSPYYDYPGAFFYNYGDHAYVDSARAEGLVAAYFLAKRLQRDDLASHILENCKIVAASLMYSYNSDESVYMHKFPPKSIGSFRFKLTRHWVRVDTAQHAICFFTRLLFAVQQDKPLSD